LDAGRFELNNYFLIGLNFSQQTFRARYDSLIDIVVANFHRGNESLTANLNQNSRGNVKLRLKAGSQNSRKYENLTANI
jgi:hypothetical protein